VNQTIRPPEVMRGREWTDHARIIHCLIVLIATLILLSNVFLICYPALIRRRSPPQTELAESSEAPEQDVGTVSSMYDFPLPKLKANGHKQEAVKKAFEFAWGHYKKRAWGSDFLKPISGRGANVLNGGLTITDALDTMLIMGLTEEADSAREWIRENFGIHSGQYSFFEIVIRHIGGLLSAYQLSGDDHLLQKAWDVASPLLPLMDDMTGLFRTYVDFGDGPPRASGAAEVLLSDIGSIQLEFYTLSLLSGDERFAKKASKIHKFMFSKYPGRLYPERINSETGDIHTSVYSVDAMSDSFYEYLIKIWLLTNHTLPVMLERYQMAVDGIEDELTRRHNNWTFVGRRNGGGAVEQTVTHLAAFVPGMLTIGAVKENPKALNHLQLANELVETFVDWYKMQPTGLMPECVRVNSRGINFCDDRYQLRPETIESLFYLYRFTGLPKYRDYAWTIFQAIETHCKVTYGYATVTDVHTVPAAHVDHMDSYFLAETLKYLYLIFSDSSIMPVTQWVFNTEAHPLRMFSAEEAQRLLKWIEG
jgi:mannosyl-oligosaccharide alpha-1,2-mannosidase